MDENKKQSNISGLDIKNIHTYTSDMADAIRQNEASVIKIALAEKEKREQEAIYKEAEGTGASKFLLFLGGIILILGAVVGSYFLFKKSNDTVSPQQVLKEKESIISYDQRVSVDVTEKKSQTDLFDSIKTDVEKVGKPKSIKEIVLTQKTDTVAEPLAIDEFLSLMGTEAPSSLVRNLDSDYMIGTYTAEDRPHLFLIFKIKDYNQAYASMLAWEKTMLHDLFIVFGIDVSNDSDTIFEKPWRDVIIDNKDARILYRRDGSDILYYIFPNKDTFIITDSQEAIKEITTRLLAKETKPL